MFKYKKLSTKSLSESSLLCHCNKDSPNFKRPSTDTSHITESIVCSRCNKRSLVVQDEVKDEIQIGKRVETIDHSDDLQVLLSAQGGHNEANSTNSTNSYSGSYNFACNDCVNIVNGSNIIDDNNTFEFNYCTSNASGHSDNSTVLNTKQNDLRDLSTLLLESIGSNINDSQTFEINGDIYLILPSKSSKTSCQEIEVDQCCDVDEVLTETRGQKKQQATSSGKESLEKKMFNLRIKDEMRIDLKNSLSSVSVQFAEAHDIYTIDEVSERSVSSKSSETINVDSNKNEELEKVRLILETLKKSREKPRPVTRKPVPLPRHFHHNQNIAAAHKADCPADQMKPSIRQKNEVDQIANTIKKKDNNLTILERQPLLATNHHDECYSIQRYLSDMDIPLETTEEDKLLDDKSTIDSKTGLYTNSRRSFNDSMFTFNSSRYGSGCCLVKYFKRLRFPCEKNSKQKLK